MVRFLPIVAPLPRARSSGDGLLLKLSITLLLPFLFQQTAAISQKDGHSIKAEQIFWISVGFGCNTIELQFYGRQSLLQFHKPLGEGRHGLGKIFCGSSDPERHRFAGHAVQPN